MSLLLPLAGALVILMVDSAIELALISSMVGYLHRSGANTYPYTSADGSTSFINAKPKHLFLNEGHTSNGAAGTSLVLICFGGFLVVWRELQRARNNKIQRSSRLFVTYTVFTVLTFLLTLAALIYTFTLYNQTKHQSITIPVADLYQGRGYPSNNWTPQTWTKALLDLPLTSDTDANYLTHWLRVMQGWMWNLIPMFFINGVVAALAVREVLRQSRVGGGRDAKGNDFMPAYALADTMELKRGGALCFEAFCGKLFGVRTGVM